MYSLGVVNAIGNFSAEVQKPVSLVTCVYERCQFSEIFMDYKVSVQNDWMAGQATCSLKTCNIHELSHLLETSDTSVLFSSLSSTKILSPFMIAYLYSFMSSGKKVLNGHKLNIN